MDKIDAYTKRNALKTLLLAQLILDELDELKETTLYNGSIKNLINKLEKLMTPFCRRYVDKIYNTDVANSINVLEIIIDNIVHNTVLDIEPIKPYNLYILKDKTGKQIKIKSELSPAEFEKEYKIKLTNLISRSYE